MDTDNFDEFYAASSQRVTTQVFAMIGDRDLAQDCVQEAFVRAWAQWSSFDQVRYPEAWVRTTAYRLAVSRWRRLARTWRAPDRALDPAQTTAAPTETFLAVVAALKQIPTRQREAIVLHHLAGHSVAEVADIVDVPVNTVKTRLRRGRAALAELLPEYAPATERVKVATGTGDG